MQMSNATHGNARATPLTPSILLLTTKAGLSV